MYFCCMHNELRAHKNAHLSRGGGGRPTGHSNHCVLLICNNYVFTLCTLHVWLVWNCQINNNNDNLHHSIALVFMLYVNEPSRMCFVVLNIIPLSFSMFLGAPSDIQQDHQHGFRRSSRQDQSSPERGLHRSYNDSRDDNDGDSPEPGLARCLFGWKWESQRTYVFGMMEMISVRDLGFNFWTTYPLTL